MRTPLTIATAMLLLSGLAACSDDAPTPKFETSTESPPAINPPPTSAAPTATPPSIARETASEFIRRFQVAAVEMQTSGSSEAYRSLTRRCESCDSLADRVDKIYGGGGSVRTNQPQIQELSRVGGHDGVQVYEYDLVSPKTELVGADGSIDQRLPGGIERYQLNVMKIADTWKVLRISQLV